jgi:toxin ParE1/3/4
LTQIELTRDAERDLIDIYLFGIEHFGPSQAERYATALHSRIAFIADNPSAGADYSAVQNGLRRYEHISHAVYFRRTSSGILVLRILHGAMDPGRHIT